MLYLKEIRFRFYYILFTLGLLFFGILVYKHFLFVLLSYFLQETNEYIYFFFTQPSELIIIYGLILIFYITYFCFPFIIWQYIDYTSAAFSFSSLRYIKTRTICFFSWLNLINYLNLKYFLPSVWINFVVVNNFLTFSLAIDIFQEFKLSDLFFFIFFYLILFNIFYFCGLGLVFGFQYVSLVRVFEQKQLIFFLFFLFLLSCVDIITTLILFTLFLIFLEIILINILLLGKIRLYYL